MKVLFSGGGTLGPVTPLLAIHDVVKEAYPQAQFFWVGSKDGPEKAIVSRYHIHFFPIVAAKWRRYVSLWNLVEPLRLLIGFFQALYLLIQKRPDLCISAGGFVSVPVHWAAWVQRIPTWVHQQDVQVGLANRLMEKTATLLTTVLKQHGGLPQKEKMHWLGNPIRPVVFTGVKERGNQYFGLKPGIPVVLVMGGGTGARRVNELTLQALPHLRGECQIVHITGIDRDQKMLLAGGGQYDEYHVYSFLHDELADAYALADVVVCRAGFGTLSELAALQKATIIIPKAGQQEKNLALLAEHHAVIGVDEEHVTGEELGKKILDLLQNTRQRQVMGERLHSLIPSANKDDILVILKRLVPKS